MNDNSKKDAEADVWSGPRGRSLTGVRIARPTCYRCLRPSSHCVCELVVPFGAHCNVLLLQHPHERKKYHSTAKIVLRAVTNSKLLRGIEFDPRVLERALGGKRPYLLYPGPGAVDCETVELGLDDTIIAIDGTWDEAQKIVHRNPFLREFPMLSFQRDIRSTYRIRKQPKERCLSTLESIAHLLILNSSSHCTGSPEHDVATIRYQALLTAFDRMIERQLVHFPRSAHF